MERRKKWTEKQLRVAVKNSFSVRKVLQELGLREAGGNYVQIKKYIEQYKISSDHFRGRGWNKGLSSIGTPRRLLSDILVEKSDYQSFKLKKRLFLAKLKERQCEICGWSKMAKDGRIPLELDHINGDRFDNRIENLRILCPNCHSLQPTHRGLNKRKNKRPGGGMVDTRDLKI